jgi:hypothetical protein
MFWGKRQFEFAKYAPYQDRLQKLLMANPQRYREFIMVGVNTDKTGVSDYYIGVPEKAFLAAFDGFETIEEAKLPKEIDTFLLADATTQEFKSRFRSRKR